jgi:hypothetical protein
MLTKWKCNDPAKHQALSLVLTEGCEEGTVQYGLKYKVYKKLETLLTADFEGRQLHVMLEHWSYFSVAALHI